MLPSEANLRAQASPMPEEAPVMKMVLFFMALLDGLECKNTKI